MSAVPHGGFAVLVGDQLGLGRQRQLREVAGNRSALELDAGVVELARVERVAAVDRPRAAAAEPPALARGQRVAIEHSSADLAHVMLRTPTSGATSNRAAISGGIGDAPSSARPARSAHADDRHRAGGDAFVAPRQHAARSVMLRSVIADDADCDVELVLEAQRPVVVERGGDARKADVASAGAMLSPAARHSACSASSM